jgi:hypothetical protein
MEGNKENSKEKPKLSFFLIVWSIFNIIMGALIFAIPALIYSKNYRKGALESRNKAIVFNVVSTIVGIAAWIYIIIYLIEYSNTIRLINSYTIG